MADPIRATCCARDTEIVIVGLGNVLVGDDALGPWVVRTLESRYDLPECVTLVDGTPGNDLVPHLSGADAVIVIDTIATPGRPGDIKLFRREQLLRKAPPPRLNPHQPGLKEALLNLDLTGQAPKDVLLIGVVPQTVETRLGLSPSVKRAVDRAVEEVVLELDRLGCPPVLRDTFLRPAIWWERPA